MANSFPLIAQLCSFIGNCLECCVEKYSEMISQGEVLRLINDVCHWPGEAVRVSSSVKCWHCWVHLLFKKDREDEIRG